MAIAAGPWGGGGAGHGEELDTSPGSRLYSASSPSLSVSLALSLLAPLSLCPLSSRVSARLRTSRRRGCLVLGPLPVMAAAARPGPSRVPRSAHLARPPSPPPSPPPHCSLPSPDPTIGIVISEIISEINTIKNTAWSSCVLVAAHNPRMLGQERWGGCGRAGPGAGQAAPAPGI